MNNKPCTVGDAIDKFALKSSHPDLVRRLGHAVTDILNEAGDREKFTAEQETQLALTVVGLLVNVERALTGQKSVELNQNIDSPN